MTRVVQICKLHYFPNTTAHWNTQKQSKVGTKSIYLRCICLLPWCYTLDVQFMYVLVVCVTYLAMESKDLDECSISGRYKLHIRMTVRYLDDGCYISRRWVLHIWTSVPYLDDTSYLSGWLLDTWTMGVTYLDDGCYISGRLLHIWTVTLHVTRRD